MSILKLFAVSTKPSFRRSRKEGLEVAEASPAVAEEVVEGAERVSKWGAGSALNWSGISTT